MALTHFILMVISILSTKMKDVYYQYEMLKLVLFNQFFFPRVDKSPRQILFYSLWGGLGFDTKLILYLKSWEVS